MSPSTPDITAIANRLLAPHNLRVTSYQTLQDLWAGYGQICRLHVLPTRPSPTATHASSTLILKLVSPPPSKSKTSDEGHLRKVISYQVESHFYTQLAPTLPASIAVAACLASINENDTLALILTDLKVSFPVAGEKRGELSEQHVHAALNWLGKFHGVWWKKGHWSGENRRALRKPPLDEAGRSATDDLGSVWLNGGYTYLATRRKEYSSLARDTQSEWSQALCSPQGRTGKSVAEKVAQLLSPAAGAEPTSAIREYETLIHGDVKSENLFISRDGDEVAFFDFQYVGLGLGVSDLAKLFTCSVPEDLLVSSSGQIEEGSDMQAGEEKLLRFYLRLLCSVSERQYDWDTFKRHWETALVDWLRFQASWGFWGNTLWLEARVRHILADTAWQEWIDDQVA